MGKALFDFGLGEVNLHRNITYCDTENYGSYRMMEKIGIRWKGCLSKADLLTRSLKKV